MIRAEWLRGPQFVNLGTATEPLWQRASMHCKICGEMCSARECAQCTAWAGGLFAAVEDAEGDALMRLYLAISRMEPMHLTKNGLTDADGHPVDVGGKRLPVQ